MSQITGDTIIADILTIAPDAIPVLRDIGMNCFGCAMATSETLAQACLTHGRDVNEILDRLTELVRQ